MPDQSTSCDNRQTNKDKEETRATPPVDELISPQAAQSSAATAQQPLPPTDTDHALVEQQDPLLAELTQLSKAELIARLVESQQTAEQHWARLLRLQAQADNASKRSERDIAHAHKFALESFVNALLPVVDSLELCLSHVVVAQDTQTPQDHDTSAMKAVIEGVMLTLKMLHTALQKFAVQQINPLAEPFNPTYHQATAMQTDPTAPSGTVIAVLQKGYTLSGRLIRPALVIVAK